MSIVKQNKQINKENNKYKKKCVSLFLFQRNKINQYIMKTINIRKKMNKFVYVIYIKYPRLFYISK